MTPFRSTAFSDAALTTLMIIAMAALLTAPSIANGQAERLTLEIGCSVRHLDHDPPLAGRAVTVTLATGRDCEGTWRTGPRAIPIRGAGNATVRSVDTRRLDPSQAQVIVTFTEPRRFDIREGANGTSLVVETRVLRMQGESEDNSDESITARSVTSLSPARVEALLAEAAASLQSGDHNRAIQIYTRLLEEPDSDAHRDALELLGVAHERNNQLALAVADYRQFLDRFPNEPSTSRVQQRLASLLVGTSASPESLQQPTPWQIYGGVHQEYLRYETKPTEDSDTETSQSAVLTYADLVIDHRGGRFDVRGRANVGYHYNLLSDDGPDDQGLVNNAYLEVFDHALDWSARVGRQSLFNDGVLGRFDGARAGYRAGQGLSLYLTGGIPVDSPRFTGDSHRPFVGTSAHLEGVKGIWDIGLFAMFQRNDDIADREAVGAETRVTTGRFQMTGLVDYDTSYGVLNSALVTARLRVTERLELTARANQYAYPFLTTQNALIGQPVTTIDALLDTYTEPQVRRIARNRTSDAFTGSLGATATLSSRWYLTGDVTYATIDGNVASAGVAARPDTGPQLYYATDLVGSSILRPGDTTILGFRLRSDEDADMATALLDGRYPIGRNIRIGPRVAVSLRQAGQAGDEQIIVQPSLRLVWSSRGRYRLELEGGGLWSSRDLPEEIAALPLYPDDTEERIEYFINLRWGIDF